MTTVRFQRGQKPRPMKYLRDSLVDDPIQEIRLREDRKARELIERILQSRNLCGFRVLLAMEHINGVFTARRIVLDIEASFVHDDVLTDVESSLDLLLRHKLVQKGRHEGSFFYRRVLERHTFTLCVLRRGGFVTADPRVIEAIRRKQVPQSELPE